MRKVVFIVINMCILFSCNEVSYHVFQTKYDNNIFNDLFDCALDEIKIQYKTNKYKEFTYLPNYSKDTGIFVRVKKNNIQFGCIGFYKNVNDLKKACRIAAVNAVFFDPRFKNHLQENDFKNIEIQITIIGKCIPMENEYDFDLKYHSLYINNGSKSAFLQNVIADEYGYSKDDFINEIKKKAGINNFDNQYLKTIFYKAYSITKSRLITNIEK